MKLSSEGEGGGSKIVVLVPYGRAKTYLDMTKMLSKGQPSSGSRASCGFLGL